ncbi:DUF2116 family Zn-ribbon domain-containing protein [Salmonella enterica]|uniref:DUF2116 family Zn-ribbon domain-containing protein n=1 Tax=Salmonella enterica TaxID=28901 RepID=A0A628V932_SALER|nr:DUF2116 family Zn-ribbon domain-containing protein [Salmonella enterica]EEC6702184.1 DUF2116 family Zn-ribbon domain-containing protein [Salmonella enterica]ELF5202446.1 DUF2116 family Zn-ribbon domain-containing protein [Salmonella enterica]
MKNILKPCPFCGKLIYPETDVCDFCQTVSPFVKARRREKIRFLFAILIIIFFIAGAILWCSG